MNKQGILRNFTNHNAAYADKLIKELALSMSREALAFCATHYKRVEKRDPYADELQMLDRLVALSEKSPASAVLTNLYTNDSYVAQTYADLLQKCTTVNPYVATPCALSELARIATLHLRRGEQRAIPQACAAYPETVGEGVVSSNEDCALLPNAPYRLRILPTAHVPHNAGDLLILVTPGHKQNKLHFYKAVERLLSVPAIRSVLNCVNIVSETGILAALLESYGGLNIHLSALSSLDSTALLTLLTEECVGCRILRIPHDSFPSVMQEICAHGMNGYAFAEVSADDAYRFERNSNLPAFSIRTQFMRQLFHANRIDLRLKNNAASILHIDHTLLSDVNCHYVCKSNQGEQGTS